MTSALHHRVPGALKITAEQQRSFAEDGFFVVENALTPEETERLVAVTDALADAARHARGLSAEAPIRVRNIVARHRAYLDLLDHPVILPLVVDVIGTRIQLRGSNLDVRPPIPPRERAARPGSSDGAMHWHRDAPSGGWPTVDGVVPFLEIKVGYFLTDLTSPYSGALRIIRGSHRLPAPPEHDDDAAGDVIEINAAPGTALVWRTSLLHQAAANYSDITRKCLYVAYQHRWLRPSDYVTAPGGLLASCNPIQRQLLGGVADPANYVKDADVEPCSTYWAAGRGDLPLQEWAERQGLAAGHAATHDVTTPHQPPGQR
jgi:ectoine hydroxylase-related dioxygenase (phytanoyl-CoA dioxygenase family)